jgi:glycosyltransferase involved in cell wall biosynthesis
VADPELSAIVLGYRSGNDLDRVAEPLYELLEQSEISYELVVVANYWPSSCDSTPKAAARFAEGRSTVRVVAQEKQGGMGWDLRSGLAAARGEVMIVIDGDAQNPVDDVLRLFHLMRERGADVAKGRRIRRDDGPYRRLISFVYNIAFQLLFPMRGIWDVNAKPKGLTRAAYERLDLRADDWFIDAEIVLGARDLALEVAELPVVFLANVERPSFVKPRAILEFAGHMIRRRLRR